ncbi:tyrosine-type recombinase/integrase [Algoriphagus sp. PAP.12]|uniref:tyrosine-type recombinase/integrase n=1 Tax=Algoriphagus sp. PAP.12 TaxID=2996678 RepID=UPI00227AA741|nr:tyrosine-type recombinase/integrase [Algoriphagus sp. PAP.12]
MKTLFYLKSGKTKPTEPNSIVLRVRLAETGKPKVKGLGISCSRKDWNQEDQQVRRSNLQFKKHNAQLKFISEQIELIERERNVNAEDIDLIVEASIRGTSIQELENQSLLLSNIVKSYRDYMEDDPTYSPNYKRRLRSVSNLLDKFEQSVKYKISGNDLSRKATLIQSEIVKFFRSEGKKDSTAKNFLTNVNACIGHYNKLHNQEIKQFVKKDTKWAVTKRKIIALNTIELKALYKFVFEPVTEPDPEAPVLTPADKRNIKHFLFRCFCGMRIGDMNQTNINLNRLQKDSTTFTYHQDKGTKTATVYCINNYLFDIAESLNWKFPEFKNETALFSYSHNETQSVRKHLAYLLRDNMREIYHNTEKGQQYLNLCDVVTTHTARKTFAHLLYDLTKDVMLVRDQLGHTKVETTMRYLDFNMDGSSNLLKNVELGF